MEKRRIVLYGKSVIVGSLEASLRLSTQYELVNLLPAHQNELEAMTPDIVLFDLEAGFPEAAFRMLGSCPGLLLIGISPDKNLVKMWSSQQLYELSTSDLLKAIQEQLNYKEGLKIEQIE